MAEAQQNETSIKEESQLLDYAAMQRLEWRQGWSKAGWVTFAAAALWLPWYIVSMIGLWLCLGDNSTSKDDNLIFSVVSLPGIVALICGAISLQTHGLTRNLPGIAGLVITFVLIIFAIFVVRA